MVKFVCNIHYTLNVSQYITGCTIELLYHLPEVHYWQLQGSKFQHNSSQVSGHKKNLRGTRMEVDPWPCITTLITAISARS